MPRSVPLYWRFTAQLGENGDLKALIKAGHPTVIVKKLSVELNCSRYPEFSIDHVSSSSIRLLLPSVLAKCYYVGL